MRYSEFIASGAHNFGDTTDPQAEVGLRRIYR